MIDCIIGVATIGVKVVTAVLQAQRIAKNTSQAIKALKNSTKLQDGISTVNKAFKNAKSLANGVASAIEDGISSLIDHKHTYYALIYCSKN